MHVCIERSACPRGILSVAGSHAEVLNGCSTNRRLKTGSGLYFLRSKNFVNARSYNLQVG